MPPVIRSEGSDVSPVPKDSAANAAADSTRNMPISKDQDASAPVSETAANSSIPSADAQILESPSSELIPSPERAQLQKAVDAAPPVDDKIFARFRELCTIPSDINEHLPVLKEYADKCESVCEMGVRSCVSLFAFLASSAKKVTAYDILNVSTPSCEKLTFICADVLKIEIEPTDLLFIDTYHQGAQLREELRLHADKVRKFLIFHDTEIFGEHGEDGGPGLNAAISEFLADNPAWQSCYYSAKNNGLTILARA